MTFNHRQKKNVSRVLGAELPVVTCSKAVRMLQDLGWTLTHGFNVNTGRGKCANMELRTQDNDALLGRVVIPNGDGKVMTAKEIASLQNITQVDFASGEYRQGSAFCQAMRGCTP